MTKLEKHIISSINNKESNESVIYRGGGFYTKSKGILQNFAILIDDNLFIRIDTSSYNISKRIFKNLDELNTDYKICLGTDKISLLLTTKQYDSDDFIHDLPSLFHLYTKGLMIIFDKHNINFKDLIFNTVEYFDCFDFFTEMLVENEEQFWSSVRSRYNYSYNYMTNSYGIKLSELENRELNKGDWSQMIFERNRSNIIDQILED